MVRAMYGGDNYATRAVQPRHPGSAPARAPRSSRSCSPRRCAQGISPAVTVGVEEADLHPQGWRALHRQQLRGRVRRACGRSQSATTYSDNAVYAQVAKQVGTKKVAQAGPQDGHPDAGLDEPRDLARRPAPGRDAARHGARVRDVRDRRQARHRLAVAGPERQVAAGARAGRHRADRAAAQGQVPRGRARRRHEAGQQARRASGCSSRTIARQVSADPADRRQGRHGDPRGRSRA